MRQEFLLSFQRQLNEARESLRLIQERMAEYVLKTDIPLQLVREERRWLDRIAELEQQLAQPADLGEPGLRLDDMGSAPQQLHGYQHKPLGMRKGESTNAMPEPKTEVVLTIKIDNIEDFDEKIQRWLQYALAAFLDIPRDNVRMTSIQKGSVKVTIELPTQSAEKLLSAYKRNEPELAEYLDPLVLLDLRRTAARRERGLLDTALSRGDPYPYPPSRHPLGGPSMDDLFSELLVITAKSKQDLLTGLGSRQAQLAQIDVARRQLEAALASAQKGKYQDALRLFRDLQGTLHKSNLLQSEWAEIYVAQAICFARLGDKAGMKEVWEKAVDLEPDNEKLREIAVRLGLIK
jgi:tetratricopeptide (TPR) repeat protein